MISINEAKKCALSLADVKELPHHEITSFRVCGKIIMTLDETRNRICVMLSPEEQSLFTLHDPQAVYPVPNAWGKKGATFIEPDRVRKQVFKDALKSAYMKATAKAAPKSRKGKV